MTITRRQLIQTTAAASLASLLPRAVFSQGAANRKAVIHADQEIGVIRPELHSHFAEHLGSCVYGGIWVGKNSPVPNIDGYPPRRGRLSQGTRRSRAALAGRLLRRRLSLARRHRPRRQAAQDA